MMTMDEFDLASQHEELRREIALRYRKPAGPAPTGLCLYCEAELPAEHRWCDAACREDWERLQRAQRERPCNE